MLRQCDPISPQAWHGLATTALSHCKPWICPDGDHRQQHCSESRICLIRFERRVLNGVLNVLQGRWSEQWNNPSHWEAWIINLGSGLGGGGDLDSRWTLQPLLGQMKWNWTGAHELELLNQELFDQHSNWAQARPCPSAAPWEPSQLFKGHSFNILERKQLLACRVIGPVHLRI